MDAVDRIPPRWCRHLLDPIRTTASQPDDRRQGQNSRRSLPLSVERGRSTSPCHRHRNATRWDRQPIEVICRLRVRQRQIHLVRALQRAIGLPQLVPAGAVVFGSKHKLAAYGGPDYGRSDRPAARMMRPLSRPEIRPAATQSSVSASTQSRNSPWVVASSAHWAIKSLKVDPSESV